VASLATSQIPHADDTVDGRSVVDGGETVLAVAISLSSVGPNAYDYDGSQSHLQFQVRGEPGTGPIGLSGAVEVQIVRLPGEPQPAAWSTTAATVPLPLDGCAPSCILDFAVHIRAAQPDSVPLVVPWRIYAIAIGDVSRLVIDVDAVPQGPLLTDLAIWSTSLGLFVALVVAMAVWAVGRGRTWSASALLEAIAALVLIGGGALVAQGLLVNLKSGMAGLFEIGSGTAVVIGLTLNRPLLSRASAWLVPLALVLPPLALAQFVMGGEFRVADVIAAFVATGVALVIAMILLVPRVRTRIAPLKLTQPRTLMLIALALAGAGVAAVWATLISAGGTRVGVGVWAPLEFSYMALLIGLWRWLAGDSVTPFIAGFAAAVAAVVSAFMTVMSFFANLGVPGPASPLLIEAVGAVALSGVLFAIFTTLPPRRKDPAAHRGRAFQTGWAIVDATASGSAQPGSNDRLLEVVAVGIVGVAFVLGILLFFLFFI
jgi:hypothetical protein